MVSYSARFSYCGDSTTRADGVMYLSSSLPLEDSKRFCSVPFQFGNVALSTLKS
jgi:hypothetical protein